MGQNFADKYFDQTLTPIFTRGGGTISDKEDQRPEMIDDNIFAEMAGRGIGLVTIIVLAEQLFRMEPVLVPRTLRLA